MPTRAPSPDVDTDAWQGWSDAARHPEVDEAIRSLYARLDADIAAHGPTCWQSGKCCNFGSYGHRLYVTALEVAWFVRQASVARARSLSETIQTDAALALTVLAPAACDDPRPALSDVCPYQADRRCTVHAIRPLGCRVFFCQEGTQDWQQVLYEHYLNELRELHRRHDIAYRYADWLALLDEVPDWPSSDAQSKT